MVFKEGAMNFKEGQLLSINNFTKIQNMEVFEIFNKIYDIFFSNRRHRTNVLI